MVTATAPAPAALPVALTPTPVQRVLLDGVSWETYERLMDDFADRSAPRFAYDRGVLEIVSPTAAHEQDHLALAAVVATVADELGIDFRPMGSTTYRRVGLRQGFEADSSFYITNLRFSRDMEDVDPEVDSPPDLVIEVDVSHPSLNKLPIYAEFGVPEVWRSRADRVMILVLAEGTYREATDSRVLPPVTSDALTHFLVENRRLPRRAWLDAVRSWLRDPGLGADSS